MIGRRFVWSDAEVRKLVARFVPVADEVHFLQSQKGPASDLFRKIAEQGHYAGRTRPTNTRQGIYAAAPSGRLLASINHNDPRRVEKMLRKALAAWAAMPRAQRLLAPAPEPSPRGRWRLEHAYPANGLVLRVVTRDIARNKTARGWLGTAWNIDHAWFTRAEARAFLPEAPAAGQRHAVPDRLIRRLVCLHMVDFVRGQTSPFRTDDVRQASLTATVASVADGQVTLALAGQAHTVRRGKWAVTGLRRTPLTEQERGYRAPLVGRASYDLKTGRFTAFELVALGNRWGATRYNCRAWDAAPAPQGIVFSLAGQRPADRVAPAHLWSYGQDWLRRARR